MRSNPGSQKWDETMFSFAKENRRDPKGFPFIFGTAFWHDGNIQGTEQLIVGRPSPYQCSYSLMIVIVLEWMKIPGIYNSFFDASYVEIGVGGVGSPGSEVFAVLLGTRKRGTSRRRSYRDVTGITV